VNKYLGTVSFFCVLAFSALPTALADQISNSYQPFTVPIESGDRFVVSGFHGSVKMIADPAARQMTIQLKHVVPHDLPKSLIEASDEWLFSLKRENQQILAQVGSPISKAVWAKLLAQPKAMPEFHLIVRGPSVPTTLSWQSGSIEIEGWKAPIEATLLAAQVKISGGEGVIELSQQTGEVAVSQHNGPVALDTYDVKASIRGVAGDLDVQNFKGRTDVAACEGKVEIQSYSGEFEVSKGKGQIHFESERGRLAISGYEGDLDSETDIGSVRAVLVGQSRVKIKTRQGNVSLRMPNSGANVNVGSEKGYLNVPKHLRYTRLPNLRLMTGRLKGKNSGRVYVRTETGEIRLR
jgi:hypothetical protein